MTDLDKLCADIESRPGAAARIEAEVERMNEVLDARQRHSPREPAGRGVEPSHDA